MAEYSVGNLKLSMTMVGFDKAITYLETIKTLTGSLSTSSKTLSTAVKGSSSAFSNIGNTAQKLGKALNFGSLLGKIYFIKKYTQQLGRSIANMVTSAIDYTETLNLWQVAMGKNIDQADEFISKMNKAYGISEQTLMNYQATFKNMLTALGGISDITGENLSEYLTQMALDYASLYNTSIEKAMVVFQSVLSGQVRPIRSISGYDITETTIYQLYQELGGQKNMRSLSQTEKRLLRIYAVFQQMDRSGAVGDLNKTFNNSANQLRVMSEQAKELSQWLGIIMEMWIKPVLPYINAVLTLTKEIVKAIAIASGYKAFDGTVAGLEEVNEELDEATGKLLSFDKFEALNSESGNDSVLGIDEKLLSGLSKYSSLLNSVSSETQSLLEVWRQWWFVDGDSDKGLSRNAEKLLDVLKAIGIVALTLIGYAVATKVQALTKWVFSLTKAVTSLNLALSIGTVYAIIEAVKAFKDGNYWAGILSVSIGTVLAGAFIYTNRVAIKGLLTTIGRGFIALLTNATFATGSFALAVTSLSISFVALGASLGLAVDLFSNWDILNNWQKIVGVLGVLTTAVLGLAMAFGVFHSAWSLGLASAGIIAGIVATSVAIGTAKSQAQDSIQYRKAGGMIEDGLFTMNKGEVMGTFDDGTSIVANNQQIVDGIKLGVYQAVTSALRTTGSSGDIVLKIDSNEVARATVNANANALNQNYRIDLQPR